MLQSNNLHLLRASLTSTKHQGVAGVAGGDAVAVAVFCSNPTVDESSRASATKNKMDRL
jgi:hypothetical protein